VQLVSKISNLCDHKSPTSQTDEQTDGRHAIPRPRICTKVHCAVKKTDAACAALSKLSCRSNVSKLTSPHRSIGRCRSWCIVPDYWIVKSINPVSNEGVKYTPLSHSDSALEIAWATLTVMNKAICHTDMLFPVPVIQLTEIVLLSCNFSYHQYLILSTIHQKRSF